MKRQKLMLIGVVSLLLLTACGDAVIKEIENDGSSRFEGINGEINIITDNKTGCKYIFIVDGMGDSRTEAISPLIDESKNFDCD